MDYLSDVAPESFFVLSNGQAVKNLKELAQIIPELDDYVFRDHVNENKNDFSSWIEFSVKDVLLAKRLRNILDKKQFADEINLRIHQLEPPIIEDIIPPENDFIEDIVPEETDLLQELEPETEIKLEVKQEIKTIPKPEIKPEPEIKTLPKNIEEEIEEKIRKEFEAREKLNEDFRKTQTEIKKEIVAKKEQRIEAFVPYDGMPHIKIPPKEEIIEKKEEKKPKDIFQEIEEVKIEEGEIPLLQLNKLFEYRPEGTYTATQEEEIVSKLKEKKRTRTYIEGFDSMIEKGIKPNYSILVLGNSGTGKTTFCTQMISLSSEKGEKCLYISFEEPEECIMEYMEEFGFNPRKYIADGNLIIKKINPFKILRTVEALMAEARGELLIKVDLLSDIMPQNFQPNKIVIDSLTALKSLLGNNMQSYNIFLNELFNISKNLNTNVFLITESKEEQFLADGVIAFYNIKKGSMRQTAIEIVKLRNGKFLRKIVPFEFSGKGMSIYPTEEIFLDENYT